VPGLVHFRKRFSLSMTHSHYTRPKQVATPSSVEETKRQLDDDDDDDDEEDDAIPIDEMLRVVQVSCGNEHMVALTDCGRVFTWGRGTEGQLGYGEGWSRSAPRWLDHFGRYRITQVQCGHHFSLVLGEDGGVWGWGDNSTGALGLERLSTEFVPRRVKALADKSVVRVACGWRHAGCLTGSGQVYMWGDNRAGQCGIGYYSLHVLKPSLVQSVMAGQFATALVLGWRHSLALNDIGDLFGWGSNERGQLGIGKRRSHTAAPKLILRGSRIRHVAAGGEFSMCIAEEASESALGLDLQRLVNNRTLADIKFAVARGRIVYAHRCIVSARCAALGALWRRRSVRSSSSSVRTSGGAALPSSTTIRLDDVPEQACVVFLRYLYADVCVAPGERASDVATFVWQHVLRLAERFNMYRLVAIVTYTLQAMSALPNGGGDGGDAVAFALPPSTYQADMLALLDDDSTADVLFMCNGYEAPAASLLNESTRRRDSDRMVPAHKVVLYARGGARLCDSLKCPIDVKIAQRVAEPDIRGSASWKSYDSSSDNDGEVIDECKEQQLDVGRHSCGGQELSGEAPALTSGGDGDDSDDDESFASVSTSDDDDDAIEIDLGSLRAADAVGSSASASASGSSPNTVDERSSSSEEVSDDDESVNDVADVIAIDNISRDVLRRLFVFVYADDKEDVEPVRAIQLLEATDCFGLYPMKRVCETLLMCNTSLLTIQNAVRMRKSAIESYHSVFLCNYVNFLLLSQWGLLRDDERQSLSLFAMRDIVSQGFAAFPTAREELQTLRERAAQAELERDRRRRRAVAEATAAASSSSTASAITSPTSNRRRRSRSGGNDDNPFSTFISKLRKAPLRSSRDAEEPAAKLAQSISSAWSSFSSRFSDSSSSSAAAAAAAAARADAEAQQPIDPLIALRDDADLLYEFFVNARRLCKPPTGVVERNKAYEKRVRAISAVSVSTTASSSSSSSSGAVASSTVSPSSSPLSQRSRPATLAGMASSPHSVSSDSLLTVPRAMPVRIEQPSVAGSVAASPTLSRGRTWTSSRSPMRLVKSTSPPPPSPALSYSSPSSPSPARSPSPSNYRSPSPHRPPSPQHLNE
jgi:Regulator of chromosome condensation (RCC1) repeat/BTB/POZ domain